MGMKKFILTACAQRDAFTYANKIFRHVSRPQLMIGLRKRIRLFEAAIGDRRFVNWISIRERWT